MQRALRNYRTRTGIVGATVSADGESEPEWPEAGRERDWAPQRTTAPIENGSLDDTSLLPQERWWKAWSSDQEAFYYWKDGSGDTQWEDPMEDPSLENVAVRTWGGAELGCETEEDPASKGNTAPNVARDWPLANGNCTHDAVHLSESRHPRRGRATNTALQKSGYKYHQRGTKIIIMSIM